MSCVYYQLHSCLQFRLCSQNLYPEKGFPLLFVIKEMVYILYVSFSSANSSVLSSMELESNSI